MATVPFTPRFSPQAATKTAFLVLDTESIPDGRLLSRIKYADDNLTPDQAIERAQVEARESSRVGSDFLPVCFQFPVAMCVIRVAGDFSLQSIRCLDAPQYRPREIVKGFWQGFAQVKAKLVSFNGRGFDLPLLELGAFRYGCSCTDYFLTGRQRFNNQTHIDLLDWINNQGACRIGGGLDVLAKILGLPGKMGISGDQVYAYYQAGRLQEINDYCMFDTLDTYFVFLRTRVLTGDLTLELEYDLVRRAREWLTAKAEEMPALRQYLDNWGEWEPWP